MPFSLQIPSPDQPTAITIETGSSAVFVGANGGGKTRLAAYIEETLQLNAHRIAAHRALNLNPAVAKISEEQALWGLRTGNASITAQIGHRNGHRWQSNSGVSLLNDFDYLIQALFADQANKSLITHQRVRRGDLTPALPTKLERLVEIWERVLPHRRLYVTGDNIEVNARNDAPNYPASEMSDGERAIFYMIGQALTAAGESLLIFDEPELHVHRSIMAKLWDELEGERHDCGFVYITHDLEFAASRAAQKFVVRNYVPTPAWTLEPVPADTGFDESIATLILGSRRPILFVEGTGTSLDLAIYRCCFSEWTVIPRGSCEEVVHSVVTMRRNQDLTRITCTGIVDADDYQPEDIDYLRDLGISVLSVSEIENVILLPAVSQAIAESEGYTGAELQQRLDDLRAAIFHSISSPAAVDAVVTRYCRRRIDRLLKKIDLSEATDVTAITAEYVRRTAALDVAALARGATDRINDAVRRQDLPALLANYENKGLLALAATHLKRCRRQDFESWLTRVLRNNSIPPLDVAIQTALPGLAPR